jgi:hypothetical protein
MGQAFSACLSPEREPTALASGCAYNAHIHAQSTEILSILFSAEKAGAELAGQLEGVVGTTSWSEYLALQVYEGLCNAIRTGAHVGTALARALQRVGEEVYEFVMENPEFVAGILAIGVIALLVPWALAALGFGAEGPGAGELLITCRTCPS